MLVFFSGNIRILFKLLIKWSTTSIFDTLFNTVILSVLTNLEELSFLTVFAFPKASNIGLACNNCCSNSP